MASELIDAFDARQLRSMKWTSTGNDESRFNVVTSASANRPHSAFLFPFEAMNFSLEESRVIQAKVLPDAASVVEHFIDASVLLARDVAGLLKQW